MTSREDVLRLDRDDPLAAFRKDFELPEGIIYLDGNSLGALPKATAGRVADVVRREVVRDRIKCGNAQDWIGMPQRIGGKIAGLIGAASDGVIAAA